MLKTWLTILWGLVLFAHVAQADSCRQRAARLVHGIYEHLAHRNFFGRKQPPYDPSRGIPLDATAIAQEISVSIPTNRAEIARDGHMVLDSEVPGPSLNGKILLSKNPLQDGEGRRERYVVLVHGIGLRHQNLHWHANELLRGGYHVAVFDLSQHGDSDPHHLRKGLGGRLASDVSQAFLFFDGHQALANARGSAYSQSVGAIAKIGVMPYLGGMHPRFLGNNGKPRWKPVLIQAELFDAGPTHDTTHAFGGFYDDKVLEPAQQTLWGQMLGPALRFARPGFVTAAENMLGLPEWPLPQSSNWGVNRGVGVLLIGTQGDNVIPPAHQQEILRRVGVENVQTHIVPTGRHLDARKEDPELGRVMLDFLNRQYQEPHPSGFR